MKSLKKEKDHFPWIRKAWAKMERETKGMTTEQWVEYQHNAARKALKSMGLTYPEIRPLDDAHVTGDNEKVLV